MIKAFDRKLDFACLSQFPGFTYWTLSQYFTNWIAPPPTISHLHWIPIVAEIFGNFLDIRIAARSLLVSNALWLCEIRRSAVTGIYPTLKDIFNVIRSKQYPAPSHLARYQETVLNRIDGLLTTFGDHICSHKKLNWRRFLDSNWAISIHGIPTDLQNLFITVTTSSILLYRIHNNLRSNRLIDLFVFDEASVMFKKWYEIREGTYLLTDYLAQAREFGMGFLIGTQMLSNLAESVLANTSTKILVGGAGLGTDYDVFASSVGLTQDQIDYLKTWKKPGAACISDPRYPNPFLLEVPRVA